MSINVNSTQISALLQLYPMAIPGAEENLQPPGAYHLGIPESIHSPSTKLFMVIDPVTLFSTSFAAGDSVRLWVNGQATSVIKPIKPGEENDRIFMELPWGGLKDGLNTLYYEVTRVSGNKEQSNPILNVLFNNPVSGITVSHPASIGPGQPAMFTLTRNYPREYDVVTLTVGAWSKTIPYVHPANPITYTLTTTDLQQIGDGTHPVSATVVDQLSNRNVSPTTSIVISANALVLPPPTVNGQTGNNFTPTQQDVQVLVPQGTLLPTDKVHVIWEGAISTPAASFTTVQQLVSAGLTFVVPRSVLAYSLGKTVKVTYVIERDGVTTSSQVLPLNILRLPATALVPPKIVEANANNVLDVTALGTQNATIHALLWTLIADGMPCWLSLEGKKADGTAHNLVLWNGLPARVNPTWVSQGFWPQALVNSYLKLLGNGTSLTIKFAVSMDMSNVWTKDKEFPDRVYTVQSLVLVIPTLTDVLDAGNQQVVEGGVTVSTTLKLKGKASIGQQVEIFDGNGPSAVSKGKATANASGDWELTITVAAGAHRLYAQSLYHSGSPVYSIVRNLTVVADIVPVIQLVTDPNAVAIPNNGSTISTSIIVSGIGTPGTKMNLVDGGGAIPGLPEISVDNEGIWSLTMTSLVPGKTYNLRAKRKDGAVSGAYNVIVAANVNATITKVNENTATGAPVTNGGSTTATTLVISGPASAGQQVQVLKGGAVIATVTANAAGTFSHTVTGQTVGDNSYTVKGLYGASPVSPPWVVKIVANVNATITKVNENTATGAPVTNGGSTTATTLVISGPASAGQQVQVLKGGAVIATVTANAAGTFSHTVTGQSVGDNSYTVKGQYGTSPVSPPWVVTINALITPTLDNVLDANNLEVNEGGTTPSTTLKLKGRASKGEQVQIFEGNGADAISKGIATANATGDWELQISVAVGGRRLYAKSLYHVGDVYSNVRNLKVVVLGFEDFEAAPEGIIKAPLVLSSGLTIIPLKPNQDVGVFGPSGNELNPSKALRLSMVACELVFDSPVKAISFKWYCVVNPRTNIFFYNTQGSLLFSGVIPDFPGVGYGVAYTYAAPAGTLIGKIELSHSTSKWIFIDDVKWD